MTGTLAARGTTVVHEPGTPRRDVEIVRAARTAARARSVSVGIALALATTVVFCISLSVGDFPVPLKEVVRSLLGLGEPDYDFIVRTLRLPRALTAVLVGAAFGLSGAIFQALARNPLASPDIIGVTAGASAAAVFAIVFVGAGYVYVSMAAFIGALATAIVVYLLAFKRGMSPYRLVLIGIGVGAVLTALTSYGLTRAEIHDAQRATVWLTGSLNGRGWEHVRIVGASLLVLVPCVLALARPLRTLQLGDDTARGLGVGVERSRTGLLVVAVGLAAVATAAAGPIAFVAFVAAPIARRLTRTPLTIIPSALAGSLLVLASDLVGRRLFAPTELPVGVITGLIGAPYLLWLLAKANRVGRTG